MGGCFGRVIAQIYGDPDNRGCPKCPLFGISIGVLSVMIGCGLAMASSDGSIDTEWHTIGLSVCGIGAFITAFFLSIAYIGEDRYHREKRRSTDDLTGDSDCDTEEASFLETEGDFIQDSGYILQEDPLIEDDDVNPGVLDSSDSFMVLGEENPSSSPSNFSTGSPSYSTATESPILKHK